jgi:glycosyltransferase involved in cell wall biosynthesis
MNSSPRISVVIPAYNSEAFVAKTIATVQQQTVPVFEIIVVDDGSKDRTSEVAAACGNDVRVLRQANGGPAAARNHGIREAKGDWIALLDADDLWLPNKIERQLACLTDGVSLVHTYCVFDETGPLTPDNVSFDQLWERNTLGTSTVLLKKSAWADVGGFDEDRSIMAVEDYNLWLRLLHKGHKFLTVRERLVDYTPAPGNLSGQHERMVNSELRNIEKIGQVCQLDADRIRAKQVKIYEEWGGALFHARQMNRARHCYSEILSRQVKLSALVRWAATYVPVSVLNLRRRNVPAC